MEVKVVEYRSQEWESLNAFGWTTIHTFVGADGQLYARMER